MMAGMPSIPSLIAARTRGNAESLKALAVALADNVRTPPAPPLDPVEVWNDAEDGGVRTGTWDEVVAARDTGELSPAEYEYLSAAVEALTMEETDV